MLVGIIGKENWENKLAFKQETDLGFQLHCTKVLDLLFLINVLLHNLLIERDFPWRVSVVLANWIVDRQFLSFFLEENLLYLRVNIVHTKLTAFEKKSSRPNITEWKDNIRWNDFYLHFASSQSIDVHRHWSRGEIQSPSYTSLSVLESRSHWQFFPKITSISNQMPWNPSKVIPTVTYKQAHFVYAMRQGNSKYTRTLQFRLRVHISSFLQQFK